MTEVSNRTKSVLPAIQFGNIKKDALGNNYALSVAFIQADESRRINREYRKKDSPTNILSFPYSHESGEILFCPDVIENEMKSNGLPYDQYLIYLYIHGLVHLAGFDHSIEMEKREVEMRHKFLLPSFERP